MAIIETKTGSYKGVDFLILTSRIAGGRKDVLFEFPNSDKQALEDLGLRPRTYNMSVIVPHDDYINKRDNLLRVLEDGEKGPLEHPFYGKIENIAARSFTIVERLTDLGRAEVQIVFAIDDDVGVPQRALSAISEVNQLNGALNDSVAADIAEDFDADEGLFGNFQAAKDTVQSMADTFDEVRSSVGVVTTEINNYASLVNKVSTEINQLVKIPQDLADSVRNVFSTVNGLFSSVEATFDAFTDPQFFNFGDNDSSIQQTTLGRVQRAQNADVLNQSMQALSLGYAYLNAAQIPFQTEEQIDATSLTVEDQYKKVQSTISVAVVGLATPAKPVMGLSDATLTALTDLRTTTNQVFDAKRVEARKIVTINTKRKPMAVLAYEYYGSTELTDTLLELNAIKGASFVEGDIKILTV